MFLLPLLTDDIIRSHILVAFLLSDLYLLACINSTAFLNRVSSNNLNCGLLLFNVPCVNESGK